MQNRARTEGERQQRKGSATVANFPSKIETARTKKHYHPVYYKEGKMDLQKSNKALTTPLKRPQTGQTEQNSQGNVQCLTFSIKGHDKITTMAIKTFSLNTSASPNAMVGGTRTMVEKQNFHVERRKVNKQCHR